MTQKFKYVGEASPVDLPGLALVEVSTGDLVEVDDEEAIESMRVSDAWEHVPDQRSKAAKKQEG